MSEQSESIGKLVTALVQVQGEVKSAVKDAENPYFHSKYATLGAVWESCRALLNKNGLAVIQTTEVVGDRVALVSTLAHTSGEWIKGRLLLMPVKSDPQGIGSAISYARRYCLAALLGIVADEDDDGNAATGLKEGQTYSTPQNRETPALGHSRGLPDVVKDAHSTPKLAGNTKTSIFEISEPIASKNRPNSFYRKAIDSEGVGYYVHDDKVIADLQVMAGQLVTVVVETSGKFLNIREVLVDQTKVPF